ncbi:MAG TPA: hypothetical protein VFK35_12525 [Candidatus Limnocylindrales bacterium]|nr:hypothetical protein [Candidatus Limnocylindrales bacterium]
MAVLLAGLLIGTTALAAPAAARPASSSPGAATTETAGVHSGRRIGSGARDTARVRVDARAAARAAAATPREKKVHERLSPPDNGAKGTPVTRATSNLVTGGSLDGITPRVVAQPAPVVTLEFPGTTRNEACGCEPPDPWIAVSPTHVVQATNGLVRISNRAGATIITMPTWALFAVPADHYDADPRIIWDPIHGRWVGVLLSFPGTYDDNTLHLAVSESADPTGAWIVYPIANGTFLPDYPGISSSSDKVVLTSNDFELGSTYVGPSAYVMDWSNILAGTDLFVGGFYENDTVAHYRPAQMLSSSARIPVIFQGPSALAPWYFEIVGSAATAAQANRMNLSSSFGIATFTPPPDPVQPGGIAISNAVDHRPTDAVYRNGALWFTATGEYVSTGSWALARYSRVTTSLNGTPPTAAADTFAALAGTHFFQPGIGINGAGTLFAMATKTDAAVFPTTMVGAITLGGTIHPFEEIESSSASYTGNRWGDYVGIAADPSAAGAVWMAHELVAADGTWRTSVARIVSDGTAPSVPGAVSQVQVIPSTLGSTVPVRTSWGAATDTESGVASYLVERSDDSGPYVGMRTQSTSITAPLRINHSYQYRISAVDAVGNVGAPVYGPKYWPRLYQSTSYTTVTGTWGTTSSTSYSGGSTRYSSTAGSTATFTATLARSIAIVTTKAASRGSFKVYVDNVYKGTISTYSATTRFRQLVYQFNWSTAGTHKIKIVVVGTSGRPRVDMDAFVVLR